MKILHTSITVKNLDQSLTFYQEVLGLHLEKRRAIPENNAEIAFLHDGKTDSRIELTYWKGKTDWSEGDELDHIAFSVSDMDKTLKIVRERNVKIAKEPYYLKGGKNRIAFIKDPNGIWLELIEQK